MWAWVFFFAFLQSIDPPNHSSFPRISCFFLLGYEETIDCSIILCVGQTGRKRAYTWSFDERAFPKSRGVCEHNENFLRIMVRKCLAKNNVFFSWNSNEPSWNLATRLQFFLPIRKSVRTTMSEIYHFCNQQSRFVPPPSMSLLKSGLRYSFQKLEDSYEKLSFLYNRIDNFSINSNQVNFEWQKIIGGFWCSRKMSISYVLESKLVWTIEELSYNSRNRNDESIELMKKTWSYANV